MIDWSRVNHFHSGENWGDIKLVDSNLVYALDAFRKVLGHPIYLSPVKGAVVAFGGHAGKSYHYPVPGKRLGMAADTYPECPLIHAFMKAMKCNLFTGIGVYPFWRWAGHPKLIGGLHLDIRPQKEKTIWWQDQDGAYHYFNHPEYTKRLFSILIMQ